MISFLYGLYVFLCWWTIIITVSVIVYTFIFHRGIKAMLDFQEFKMDETERLQHEAFRKSFGDNILFGGFIIANLIVPLVLIRAFITDILKIVEMNSSK